MIIRFGHISIIRVLLMAPLLFILSENLQAQKNFTVRNFDESNGLSSNFVEAITQEPSGHLIIANKGGIDRFDGQKFKKTSVNNDTLGLDYVTSIHRAEDEIWFGRFDGGIGVIRDSVTLIETEINGQVKHIYKDDKSGIWAFYRSGMVFWANGPDTCRYDMSERDLLINAVIPYKHKEFIIGSNDGLWLIRFESGNDFQVLRQVEGLPETRITALKYNARRDILWVGTEDAGLQMVRSPFTKSQTVEEFILPNDESIDDVQTIFSDHLGRIWLGTFGKGLLTIEFYGDDNARHVTQQFEALADEKQLIRDIFEDSENNIWIATFGGGLVQVVENVFHQPFDAKWLKSQSITQLFRDSKGNVWLGIDKGIFRTTEHSAKSIYEYFHIGGNQVSAIAEDKEGKIWIGTSNAGVYCLSPNGDKFKPLPTDKGKLTKAINSIVATDDGAFVSTKAGLMQFSSSGKLEMHLTTLDGLPHNNVKFCYPDSDNRLWIACQGNRVSYLWDGDIRFIGSQAGNQIVDVNHILEDDLGRLWFASLGQGLYILDNGIATNLNAKNGLPSNYCYQMVLDNDSNIWVSHQKSLTQLTSNLEVRRIVSREELAPTESSMVSFLFKDDEGNIWIASTHNVVKFNPSIDKSSRTPPLLSIGSMKLNGKVQVLRENLVLPYNKYEAEFQLAGVSLRNPEGIKYRYQLKGLSNSWHELGASGRISRTLANGNYILSVLASKNNGEWNAAPVVYKFSIERPFWFSWYFWLALAIMAVLAVVTFVKYRTNKLIEDKAELEIIVSERTEKIQEQKTKIERSRDEIAKYAKDITDSIKYAKRIQNAIFPDWDSIKQIMPDAFVFFQSKDLVSGDFYFADKINDKIIFCAVDCTGHGVPGAFMSIVANNLLNQAVRQEGFTKPSDILEYLSHGVTNTLHQTYEESSVKDGMDIALCCWDTKNNLLEYAGAYNPLFIYRDGELLETKGNRFPCGAFVGEEIRTFTNHIIPVEKDDMIYVFSDGYADQFGGPNGKKFMMRRFREYLKSIHGKPVAEQHILLQKQLKNWKGNLEQVDDIVIMGVRIS
jgi:ligand-binding sensor domain-containing protein/serine phosphatase RsbU (regulator of sigma subunit)